MTSFQNLTRKQCTVVGFVVSAVVLGAAFHMGVLYGRGTPPARQAPVAIESLRASGGLVQHNDGPAEWAVKGKPIWSHLSRYHRRLGFVGLNRDSVVIHYLPDKNVYRIDGKVLVCYPNGTTRVVEDGDIRVPGSPRHLSGDRYQEMARCQRLAQLAIQRSRV